MNSSTISIAIADDHNLVRGGIIEMIQKLPELTVIADAENGQELINKISLLEMPPDVCILDINMPVLNGYNTIIKLKMLYPNMKFLALTMINIEYCIIRMIKNGVNGYLLKNCRIEELHQAIVAIHTQGYYYSSAASRKSFAAVKNSQLNDLTQKELQFLCYCCTEFTYEKIGALMHEQETCRPAQFGAGAHRRLPTMPRATAD